MCQHVEQNNILSTIKNKNKKICKQKKKKHYEIGLASRKLGVWSDIFLFSFSDSECAQ